jgi:dephospho-CoA kinase
MLKLKKIAITGGLAAGKTTVCQFFKELGASVISADEIVHKLLSSHTQVGQQVAQLLGSDILVGSEIDRKKVSEKVFPYPEKLRALERIIHPAVFDEIEKQYNYVKRENKYPLFIAEIPLLYESANDAQFDAIVCVVSDLALCKERFIHKQHHSELEFNERMARQFDPENKAKESQYLLYNNSTYEDLKAQVNALFSILTSC